MIDFCFTIALYFNAKKEDSMPKDFVMVAVMPETRALANRIAAATNDKKNAVYDRAILAYARKMGVAAAGN